MTAAIERQVEPPGCPPAEASARAVRQGTASARETLEACLSRIAALEGEVRAWHFLDPALARSRADAVDRDGPKGLLAGVPVGLKDTFDTADMPTENGSALDAGRRPGQDATAVARLRQAGAVFPGKLVTTEYAFFTPGKTRNPHDLGRTPGGSSSGPAAAVAAGMVPVALGSQTVGSVIRPAAFCGVFGMKPSYGAIPTSGLCPFAPSLDKVGAFARSLRDLALVIDAISGEDGRDEATRGVAAMRLMGALDEAPVKPRLALVRTFAWPRLEAGLAGLYEGTARRLGAVELSLPEPFDDAFAIHRTIMTAEAREALDEPLARGRDRLSPALLAALEEGERVGAPQYLAAKRKSSALKASFEELMEGFDAAITPPARGEAPMGLESTGDPVFCLLWTLIGASAINLPAFQGANGMPVGLQVVAPRGRDLALLRAARWIAERLGLSR